MIPEGFSRKSAVYGGTFMLNQSLQEILYKDKKVIGIKDGDKVAYCDQLIINPVYLVDIKEDTRLSLIGKVI